MISSTLLALENIENSVKLGALFLEALILSSETFLEASILIREASIEAILLLSEISLEKSEALINRKIAYLGS